MWRFSTPRDYGVSIKDGDPRFWDLDHILCLVWWFGTDWQYSIRIFRWAKSLNHSWTVVEYPCIIVTGSCYKILCLGKKISWNEMPLLKPYRFMLKVFIHVYFILMLISILLTVCIKLRTFILRVNFVTILSEKTQDINSSSEFCQHIFGGIFFQKKGLLKYKVHIHCTSCWNVKDFEKKLENPGNYIHK